MICPSCKKEISDGTSFCTECGYKFNNGIKEKTVKKTKEIFSEEVTIDWNHLMKFWFILMGLSLVTQTLNLFVLNDNSLAVLSIASLAVAVASGIFAIVMILKNKINIKNALIFVLAEIVGLFPIFASIIVSLIANEDGISWTFKYPSIWITFGSTLPLAVVWALIFGGINQKRFSEFKTIKLNQKNKKVAIISSIVLAVVFAGMFGAIKIRKAVESPKEEKYLAELEKQDRNKEEQDRNKYENLEGYVLTDATEQKLYVFDEKYCLFNNTYCEYDYDYNERISLSSIYLGVGNEKTKNPLSIFVSFDRMSQAEIDFYKSDLKRALEYNESNTNSFEAHKTKHENYKFSYSASSYLVETLSSGTTRYSPDNLGTVTGTPWVPENKNGRNGKGESITLKGEYDAHLMLAIRNGYQSTKWDDIYKKNARVKTFDIFCEESGMSMTVNLYDSQDTQVVDIRDILPKSGFSSITINLIVTDVYNGSKYSDLCVDSIIPYFGEGPSPSKVQIISDSNAEKNYAAEKKENTNDWMWKCKLYVPAGIDWDDYFTLEELYSGLSENTVMETKVNGDRISITTTSVIDGITIATLNAVYECDKTNKYFTILGFTANTIGGNVSKAVYDIEDYGYCVGSIPSALESFFGKK